MNRTCSRRAWEGNPKFRLLAEKSERKGRQESSKYSQEDTIKRETNTRGKIWNVPSVYGPMMEFRECKNSLLQF